MTDRDPWADGYASARAYYGDSAPIALDKIRDTLLQFRADNPKARHLPIIHNLVNELQAILDNATEPRQ